MGDYFKFLWPFQNFRTLFYVPLYGCYIVFRDKPIPFLRLPVYTPDCLIPGFLESKPCFQNQNFGCRLIRGEASFTIQEIYSIEGKKNKIAINYVIALGNVMLG